MANTLRPGREPRYWRSPDEQAGDPRVADLLGAEFLPLAAEAPASPENGISRRRFLGLLGAAAALGAGSAGCGRKIDRGSIVPYTNRPDDALPGSAAWYASSMAESVFCFPLLVKTREARPILIEGNDSHEDARGAAPLRAQAELLGLYDPERLQNPRHGNEMASWKDAEAALLEALRNGPALLITPAVMSPSRQVLIDRLGHAVSGLRHVAWEAAAPHGALQASRELLGSQLVPRLHVDRAKVILCLEADLFSGEGDVSSQIRGFADGRRLGSAADATPENMNRLWVAESRMTLTGGKADVRLPLRGSRLAALGFALARELRDHHGLAWPVGLPDLNAPTLKELAAEASLDASLLDQLAKDLAQAGPAALVVAGLSTNAEVHASAILLNRILGAEGRTVDYRAAALSPLLDPVEMAALGQELARGAFKSVILLDVNPAYDAPAVVDWKAALAAAGTRIHLGRLPDESAALCDWSLATNHWLESWGDLQGGLLQQPAVAPLFDTRQSDDLLLGALRALGQTAPENSEAWLKESWRATWSRLNSPLSFELFWHGALHDGFVKESLALGAQPVLANAPLATFAAAAMRPAAAGMDLSLFPDRRLYDGRGANIGWLQELPDPVTKGTWGNPLSMSPADAKKLGLKPGSLVQLKSGDLELSLPLHIQPGQKSGTLALALGYGREGLAVAAGIGVNTFPLARDGRFQLSGVVVTALDGESGLHNTQEHHLMEGRDLVRSLPLAAYATGETGAPSHGAAHGESHGAGMPTGHDHGLKPKQEEPLSLYPTFDYKGHKWGMAIDLTACVGCAGCVIACQAENNIPTVGPERVDEGREMHWIRIDRYYEGGEENPDMVFQPMLCQHCDHAPCENVCPVAATTHNEEGLNQMTYNRCVGTRYCANNCPYKVRRFNYFDYTGDLGLLLQMANNPEVSVRPRGVMEKCTFCVQRINEVKSRAKGEHREVRDGEMKPACAVACAAGAITFGDLNAETEVARMSHLDRRYKVLEELGVRPAVTYLAEVRNPISAGGAHES